MKDDMLVANWKMNLKTVDIYDLVTAISAVAVQSVPLVLCPAFPYLAYVSHLTALTDIAVGAQDCAAFENGAYTGQVSAAMLRDVGCQYVILGHSERRSLFAETDDLLKTKIEQAHKHGLTVIYCVGETLEQRDAGERENVLSRQLAQALPQTANKDNTILAYEPVWAIGTGHSASAEDVTCASACLKGKYDFKVLYGGSINEANATTLNEIKTIDGLLVGGASLQFGSFIKILEAMGSRV